MDGKQVRMVALEAIDDAVCEAERMMTTMERGHNVPSLSDLKTSVRHFEELCSSYESDRSE